MLELALTKAQFDKWDEARKQKYFEKHPDSSFLPEEQRKKRVKSRPATLEEKINTRKKRIKKKLTAKLKKVKQWYKTREPTKKELYAKIVGALEESGAFSIPSKLLFATLFGPLGLDIHKQIRLDEKVRTKLLKNKGISVDDYKKINKDTAIKDKAKSIADSSVSELESYAKKGYRLVKLGDKQPFYYGARGKEKPADVWERTKIDAKDTFERIKAGTKVKVMQADTKTKQWTLLKTIHVK